MKVEVRNSAPFHLVRLSPVGQLI